MIIPAFPSGNPFRFSIFLLLMISLSGCTLLSGKEVQDRGTAEIVYSGESARKGAKIWPEELLKDSFQDYWSLRFEGHVEKIFAMEAPYIRFMVEPEKYRTYMKGAKQNDLVKLEILNVKKGSDYHYTVVFNSHFVTQSGEAKKLYREDEWVEVDGKWYHILRNRIFFPQIS